MQGNFGLVCSFSNGNNYQKKVCSFSPKLPHIHVGLHCIANDKNQLWKGLLNFYLVITSPLILIEQLCRFNIHHIQPKRTQYLAVNGTTGCWVHPSIKWGRQQHTPQSASKKGCQQHILKVSNAIRVAATPCKVMDEPTSESYGPPGEWAKVKVG